jgi:hypothetical protein
MGRIWYYPCGEVVKVIRLLNLKTEKEQPGTPNGRPFLFIESRNIGAVCLKWTLGFKIVVPLDPEPFGSSAGLG